MFTPRGFFITWVEDDAPNKQWLLTPSHKYDSQIFHYLIHLEQNLTLNPTDAVSAGLRCTCYAWRVCSVLELGESRSESCSKDSGTQGGREGVGAMGNGKLGKSVLVSVLENT